VVSLVNEIIGNGITPIWGTVPSQRAEPQSWVADINKAKLLLGWEPATPLRAGLRQTVEWLREHQQYYL
jgi:nucleoside-diphosphate-sugar epimerase